jgi:WD40 repeat protein
MSTIYRYIGIDFGTSTSVVCYMDYDKDAKGILTPLYAEPLPLKFDEVYPAVPTAIQLAGKQYDHNKGVYKELADESWGRDALLKLGSHPDLVKQEFKMNLINDDPLKAEEAKMLTKKFYRKLYETYKNQRSHTSGSTIEEYTKVSYPSKWPLDARKFLVDAAREAGFPNVEGIEEPVAAMKYCLNTETEQIKMLKSKGVFVDSVPLSVLLIDMGAGTTDLVVYQYTPLQSGNGNVNVLAVWPRLGDNITFGGREVDEILTKYVEQYIAGNLAEQFNGSNGLIPSHFKLKDICKTWKELIVSPSLQKNNPVNGLPDDLIYLEHMLKSDASNFNLDRDKFCTLLKDYLSTFPTMVENVLRESGPDSGNIDLIVITGGHSQWYFATDILLGKPISGLKNDLHIDKIINEPWRIIKTPYPQQVVAQGLAMIGKTSPIQKTLETIKPTPANPEPPKMDTARAFSNESVLPSQIRMRLVGHTGDVESIAFSPDSRILASGSKDKTIKLWNLEDGKVVHTLIGHTDRIFSLAFSPDGRFLVSVGGTPAASPTPRNRQALTQIATMATTRPGEIKLWDAKTGKLIWSDNKTKGHIKKVQYSSDGKFVAAMGWDLTLKIFEAESGRLIREIRDPNIRDVALSPDNKYMAQSNLFNINLWDIQSGKKIKEIRFRPNQILFANYVIAPLGFSRDGKYLAVGAGDFKTLKIWDTSNWVEQKVIDTGFKFASISYNHNGKLMALKPFFNVIDQSYKSSTGIVNIEQGNCTLANYSSTYASINMVEFSPDGKYIAIAGSTTQGLYNVILILG